MLSAEHLEKNKQKFLEVNSNYGIFTEELSQFLGDNFYTAPASTNLDMYGCFPGGLLNHLLKACKYAVKVNESLPDTMRVPTGTIIRCIMLSQIGKVYLFQPNPSEWHRKNLGKMYEFVEDLVSMRVGERSVYYATSNGVKLTEEEYQSILNVDKNPDDLMAKYHSTVLSNIVRHGFEIAILEEKNGPSGN